MLSNSSFQKSLTLWSTATYLGRTHFYIFLFSVASLRLKEIVLFCQQMILPHLTVVKVQRERARNKQVVGSLAPPAEKPKIVPNMLKIDLGIK